MTDIEPKEVFRQKAIDLINEYRQQRGDRPIQFLAINAPEISALIRSVQLHEKTKQELADFKQKVSDKLEFWMNPNHQSWEEFAQFIIPKPKPDPLEEVCKEWWNMDIRENDAETLRELLEARGLEIREKGV
jgi:hypothetical protein